MRAVLALATRAPSAHNAQPWQWRVTPGAFDLYTDPVALRTAGDDERRDLLLGCGAGLHHLTVALAAMGWHAKIRRLPDPADAGHLASVEMVPRPAGELDLVLAAAIDRRRTNRRRFGSWPVPWNDIALMGARAARAGVMLRQVDNLPGLGELVAASVARYAPAATGDDAGAEQATEQAVVVTLGTETDDRMACLRAGEAASLVLLSATAMGLASCAVTEPLQIPGVRRSVRADAFGGSGHPQLMVRLGWPAVGAAPLAPTPRRPLAEAAEWAHYAAGRTAPYCAVMFATWAGGRDERIVDLFTASFSDAEGEQEGAAIRSLVRDLLDGTDPADIEVFTAEDDGTLIGAAIFTRLRYLRDDRAVFLLSPMAVATERQGLGIGQDLLRHALQVLRAGGVDVVITYGDPDFYGHVGFEPLSEETARAPLPLSRPEGWLGLALSESPLTPLRGPSACVAALTDPYHW
jgi:predicted N-acetyltransferase YhbS/nitroreductase